MSNWVEFQKKYAAASLEVKNVIDSGSVASVATTIRDIDPEHISELSQVITALTDALLDIIGNDHALSLIIKPGAPQATRQSAQLVISDFLTKKKSSPVSSVATNVPLKSNVAEKLHEDTIQKPTPLQKEEPITPTATERPALRNTRTMPGDIASLKREEAQRVPPQEAGVPRYARPLTEAPRYDGAGDTKK